MQQGRGRRDPVKESQQIMRKIGQIRQTLHPTKPPPISSGHRWEKYLPANNASLPHYASASLREDQKWDSYRSSLEQRLDRLFREQKELLKERHFKDSGLMEGQGFGFSEKAQGGEWTAPDTSVEQMERKIRQLEEKYQASRGRQLSQPILIRNQDQSAERAPRLQEKGGMTEVSQLGCKVPDSVANKCDAGLEAEVEALKRAVGQIQRGNKLILAKMGEREQKRQHKGRTRQILGAILQKLDGMDGGKGLR